MSNPKNLDPLNTNGYLSPLLIKRVSGTENNTIVRNFITKKLKEMKWEVELDSFSANTPSGIVQFANIIATLNQKAKSYITLAAHFDSKYFEEFEFIGASDSAVPCAMLLDIADSLKKTIDKQLKSTEKKTDIGLKLIFFDGEEAFVEWNNTDSIYGAKNLADKMQNSVSTYFDQGGSAVKHSQLDEIEVLVLLDLIGGETTQMSSLFENTHRYYTLMYELETQLIKNKLIPKGLTYRSFSNRTAYNYLIEDDHMPFLEKGVSILHLIPAAFPSFWHKEEDNINIIHHPTVVHFANIMRAFVVQALCLSEYIE